MKKGIRTTLTATASASLLALTGCAGLLGPNVEDAPALSEIDELMWQSMEESGSVTIVADMEDFAETEPESAAMFEQMFGDEGTEMKFYGELDGSATAMSIGDNDLMRVFGDDEAYLSADAIFNMFEGQNMGLTAQQEEELNKITEEFSGTWMDYSSELQASSEEDSFDVGSLFTQLQDSWEDGEASESSPIERDQISDEGTHEVRDDTDVWVYTGNEEGQELVLEANHEAPKILEISDGDVSMAFTAWGETEAPQRPEESQIATQEDMEQQMAESMTGGSSPMGNSESSFGATTPSTPAPSTPSPSTPSNSGSTSESSSGSNSVNVPGAGTVDCTGPIPGDEGFTDPNGNYTDEEIQAFQDACDRTPNSDSNSSGGGSSADTVDVPGLGSFDCSGEIPGDPGVSTLDDDYTYGDLMKIYDACDRPGDPTSAMDNEEAK